MYTNTGVLDTLNAWAQETSVIVDKYLDITAPFLLEQPRIAQKHQFVLKHLAISCNYTSHSALILVANGSLWEAEMLARAVMEGSIKYAFLCSGETSDELEEKVDEYWEQLYEIEQLKEHKRSAHFLSIVGEDAVQEWKPIKEKLLPDVEFEELQKKYPKRTRQSIEQKWSFSEIIHALAKSNMPELKGFTGFAYNYSLGSHFVHQDSFAVRLVWDRNHRDDQRKSALELAHGGRECSDILMMARLRAVMTLKLHGESLEPVRKLQVTEEVLSEKLKEAYKLWYQVEYGEELL